MGCVHRWVRLIYKEAFCPTSGHMTILATQEISTHEHFKYTNTTSSHGVSLEGP